MIVRRNKTGVQRIPRIRCPNCNSLNVVLNRGKNVGDVGYYKCQNCFKPPSFRPFTFKVQFID